MKYVSLLLTPMLLCSLGLAQSSSTAGGESQTPPGMTAILPAMPVGADDLISVQVYDATEFTRMVRVDGDGTIRLPMLQKKIKVAGMIPSQIEVALSKELQEEGILVDPVVTVGIIEYRSRPISVTGAVKSPISFQALPGTTLLDAITRAQGVTEDAGTELIVSKSVTGVDGKVNTVSQRIPLKGVLNGSDDSASNIILTGGETIRVPEGPKIFVVGDVSKPGAITVHDTLGEATVLKAIALSQGLGQFAAKTAYIYRRELGASHDGIPVQLAKIMERKEPDVALQADDILYIPDSKSKRITLGTLEKTFGLGASAMGPIIYSLH